MSNTLQLATILLHADDETHAEASVAPSISVSTTFRAPAPQKLEYIPDPDEASPDRHIYSRYTSPVTTRVESVLKALLGAHAITYASGIAATNAALVHLNPKRIAIREGYHGVHSAIEVFKKVRPDLKIIDIDDIFESGDICWLETPVNPKAYNKRTYEFS